MFNIQLTKNVLQFYFSTNPQVLGIFDNFRNIYPPLKMHNKSELNTH